MLFAEHAVYTYVTTIQNLREQKRNALRVHIISQCKRYILQDVVILLIQNYVILNLNNLQYQTTTETVCCTYLTSNVQVYNICDVLFKCSLTIFIFDKTFSFPVGRSIHLMLPMYVASVKTMNFFRKCFL